MPLGKTITYFLFKVVSILCGGVLFLHVTVTIMVLAIG